MMRYVDKCEMTGSLLAGFPVFFLFRLCEAKLHLCEIMLVLLSQEVLSVFLTPSSNAMSYNYESE